MAGFNLILTNLSLGGSGNAGELDPIYPINIFTSRSCSAWWWFLTTPLTDRWIKKSVRVNRNKRAIKANSAKAGDAKLWVYHHTRDQDRQAAEDHQEQLFGIRLFYSDGVSNLQELLIVPKVVSLKTIVEPFKPFGTFYVHSLPARGG